MPKELYGYLAMMTASVTWGVSGLINKNLLLQGIAPLNIAFLKATLATLTLVGLYLLIGKKFESVAKSKMPLLILCGILSVAASSLLSLNALKNTSVSVTTMLIYTAPIYAYTFAVILKKELLSVRKLVIILIALGGTFLIAQGYNPQALALNSKGFFFATLAAINIAVYSMMFKFVLGGINPVTLTLYSEAASASFLLFWQKPAALLPILANPAYLMQILVLAWLVEIISFVLYIYSLNKIQVSTGNVLTILNPVVSTLGAFLIFAERVEWQQIAGMVIVILTATSLTLLESKQENSIAQPESVQV